MKFELPEHKKQVHEMVIPIRWGDMDAMGHVNNTVYFRYMEQARIEWLESIIQQCRDAGVACFVKQLGSNPIWAGAKCSPIEPARGKCDDPAEWPESLRVQEVPQ